LISPDGTAAICARVESNRRIGDAGYYHRLINTACPVHAVHIKEKPVNPIEMHELAVRYHAAMTAELYATLSDNLCVSADSLKRLKAGTDGRAYTFPMKNAAGHIIGIRRRFDDGVKVCVRGSMNGLFIPDGLTGTDTLIIVEGNTDCAAALDFGYDAIGRPNCNSLINETIRFVRKHNYVRIVVIPDNDIKFDGTNPGLTGGYRLAERLRLHCRDVRVVLPPAEYNDLRCWAHLSLTRIELDRLIEAAEPIQIEVHV
jgi:hypothetical protein